MAPYYRRYHSAAYDVLGNRIVMFGGGGNDTWSAVVEDPSIGPWSALRMEGELPAPRVGHTLVGDGLRRRLFLIGGSEVSRYPTDVWVLELSEAPRWDRLSTVGTPPPGRAFHSAVRITSRNVVAVEDPRSIEQIFADGHVPGQCLEQRADHTAPGFLSKSEVQGFHRFLRGLLRSEAGPLVNAVSSREIREIEIAIGLSHPVLIAPRHLRTEVSTIRGAVRTAAPNRESDLLSRPGKLVTPARARI